MKKVLTSIAFLTCATILSLTNVFGASSPDPKLPPALLAMVPEGAKLTF